MFFTSAFFLVTFVEIGIPHPLHCVFYLKLKPLPFYGIQQNF